MNCPVCNRHYEKYQFDCACGYRFINGEKAYYVIGKDGTWRCGCGITNGGNESTCKGCAKNIGVPKRNEWIGYDLSRAPVAVRSASTLGREGSINLIVGLVIAVLAVLALARAPRAILGLGAIFLIMVVALRFLAILVKHEKGCDDEYCVIIDDKGINVEHESRIIPWGDVEQAHLRTRWVGLAKWQQLQVVLKPRATQDPAEFKLDLNRYIAKIQNVGALEPETLLEIMNYKIFRRAEPSD